MKTRVLALSCLLPAMVSMATAQASEKTYVVCDNGLRCFAPPCPSTSALDVASGKTMKGIWLDLDGLAASQRTDRLSNDLFAGKVAVRSHVERRAETFFGKRRVLPYLVVTGIARRASPSESGRCAAAR